MSKDKYRVLVADDDAFVREVVCMIAAREGCAVDGASNGQEVLSKLQDNSYALILMDYRMPGMDGYEATRAVRAGGDNTPIIGMSSSLLVEDNEEGLNSGMNEFIDKSLISDKLGDLIKQYPVHK